MILGTLFDDVGYPEGSFWRSGGYLGPFGFRGWFWRPKTSRQSSPFWVILAPLGTLGTFLDPRTSKIRCFFDHLLLDHILHRFWAPFWGGRHAIRSCRRMFRKGRPFLKRVHFEVHLRVILERKRRPESQLYSFWGPCWTLWGHMFVFVFCPPRKLILTTSACRCFGLTGGGQRSYLAKAK